MTELSIGDLMELIISGIIILLFLPIIAELSALNGISLPFPSLNMIVEVVKWGLIVLIGLAFFNTIAESL